VAVATDGQINQDGIVYYRIAGRMATGGPSPQVDITDGNDASGIAAVVYAELEYYFRPNDILSAWRFQPSSTISASNVFVYY
jgi:hypothetical protein